MNFSVSWAQKPSQISFKTAKKTLGLWINQQSNGKNIQFETEAQVGRVQAKWKRDKHNMSGGEPQEKLPVAVTTEPLMPLDDYILKKPMELRIVEKYLKNFYLT